MKRRLQQPSKPDFRILQGAASACNTASTVRTKASGKTAERYVTVANRSGALFTPAQRRCGSNYETFPPVTCAAAELIEATVRHKSFSGATAFRHVCDENRARDPQHFPSVRRQYRKLRSVAKDCNRHSRLCRSISRWGKEYNASYVEVIPTTEEGVCTEASRIV
ncbi:hypothetical protein Trydic_g8782 [Trypoxylus dichotomus]